MRFKLFILFCWLFALIIFASGKIAYANADGFWHTQGNKILDANNQSVSINGINWFGLETPNFAPHGLWSRNYKEMMDQIKNLHYNTIRLPFSNQAFDSQSAPNGIDYGKNPDLQELSALGIMDKIVEYAQRIGLKVILDRHRPDASSQSALWYTGNTPEGRWIDDWKMLAGHYNNNPTVVGADLHNEPHDNACWGCGNPATDWKEASEKAGNAILAVNPNWLIIIEGVQNYNNDYYWWGGNLSGVKDHPVNLNIHNKLVYSTHDYPPSISTQPWFSDSKFPSNLPAVWDTHWGYIQKNNIAPVLIGEFGSRLQTSADSQWFDSILNYIKANNFPWCFWSLNPDSGDTGGILLDDWVSVDQNKQQKLASIQNLSLSNNIPVATAIPTKTPVPTQASSVPTLTPSPINQPSPTISGNITLWWPLDNVKVSGTQPFKALIDNNTPLSSYTMYWQVDGGQLNLMSDNNQDSPHKEAQVDVTNWYWHGEGPYNINIIAKDSTGKSLSQKAVNIFVAH